METSDFSPGRNTTRRKPLLSYKGLDRVSVLSLRGRLTIPFVCGTSHHARLSRIRGEADLIERDGMWFLLQTVELPEPPPTDVADYLGVDLGIVNLATDSDGTAHSGKTVHGLRRRHHRLRQRLQSKQTKSAKRLLKQRRRKETRFQRDVNHCLSKTLVTTAQRTGRGLALEDLTGIRTRIRAQKPQRRVQSSWAFTQLRQFIEYKAKLAGVPLVLVDPRNTSRTCPVCGHCEKANRKTQVLFSCVRCFFSGNADTIAAEMIRRAAVNRPDVDAA
ncbi:MAG: IS200/IS605 family element transposase accessory protein TnpB [Candidatus Latescibacteria bacterium]|nr:IS200/IS605 family element transposase accessory protein TnpB [Candidatus Latescibacterota bacterium]